MRKYDIATDIKRKPNFYYPINGRKVKDLRISKNWDEETLVKKC